MNTVTMTSIITDTHIALVIICSLSILIGIVWLIGTGIAIRNLIIQDEPVSMKLGAFIEHGFMILGAITVIIMPVLMIIDA
jgi:signal transduction histidine kinase